MKKMVLVIKDQNPTLYHIKDIPAGVVFRWGSNSDSLWLRCATGAVALKNFGLCDERNFSGSYGMPLDTELIIQWSSINDGI